MFLALQTFAAQVRNQHVLLLVDNMTAIAYLNHQGGTHSRKLSDLAIEVWNWALKRGLTLHAEHIPGVLNVTADRESRMKKDASDWKLAQKVFRKLMELWGPCDLDVFAARHNSQLPRYYSFKPDPQALAVDALAQDWRNNRPYMFPPFILLGRTLQKLIADQVEEAVLIAPRWPSQPWYPLLLQMLVDLPRIIPLAPSPVHDPLGNPHPLAARLHLVAWRVSGVCQHSRGFRRKLSSSSVQHGGRAQRSHMESHGDDGMVGVVDGTAIPSVPLWP